MSDHFNNNKKVLWLGVNGMEYISWENSDVIIEFDPYYYPMPSHVIQHSKKILTEDDMFDALSNGKWHVNTYEEVLHE
ncbi:hypothetical protein CIL05_07690 [Virgibacillus profundi]|uniref:Uncharacterized protein n=1 Tax=Virgibacillus profundi TaxID=2024555 RepID=A0A2A2IGH3_9BACI|nr:hypothetical protein [Virgibacillus profundi]PAV30344.1 hypothetical protein CIL05_07690 [Virgibacillus profundi]PXY54516.1 hypothetical protein CIT14_07775 [Virgibacillus profundi]